MKEEKTIGTERGITMEEWNARQRNQQIQSANVTSKYQYGKKKKSFPYFYFFIYQGSKEFGVLR